MKWEEVSNKEEFIHLCETLCEGDQARYSLIYGMALDMDKFGSNLMLKYGEKAIAFQTNENKALVVTDLKQKSASALASWLELNNTVKEIVGSKDTINLILDHMRSTSPGYPELIMDQRIYRIDKVDKSIKIKNKLIKAEKIHKKLVMKWFEKFLIDAFIDTNPTLKKIENLANTRLEHN
jgi:hypothetical protein